MLPHRRYNSRIINFALNQARTFGDRAQTVIRHLKMGLSWSAQVALYPFYSLLQTTRLASQGLGTATRKGIRAIRAVVVPQEYGPESTSGSAALIRVIESIEILGPSRALGMEAGDQSSRSHEITLEANEYQVTVSPLLPRRRTWFKRTQKALHQWITKKVGSLVSRKHLATILPEKPKIQGIASMLDTRSIGLVTSQNQVLDILTPLQQKTLRARMSWELASLYRRRRRVQCQERWIFGTGLLSILQAPAPQRRMWMLRPTMFAGVRYLRKGLNWLAQGSVAQTLNVFHEQELSALPQTHLVSAKFPSVRFPSALPQQLNAQPHPALPLEAVSAFPKKLASGLFRALIGAIASLPIVAIPAIAAEPNPQPIPESLQLQEPLWVDPARLQTSSSKFEVKGEVQGLALRLQGKRWLASQKPNSIDSAPIEKATQTTPVQPKIIYTAHGPEVRIDAEFLGYEPHLLERILGWLDVALTFLESGMALLWTIFGIVLVELTTYWATLAEKFSRYLHSD